MWEVNDCLCITWGFFHFVVVFLLLPLYFSYETLFLSQPLSYLAFVLTVLSTVPLW